MSAPDTNVERQEAKHKPALLGIRGAIIFGALMLLLVILFSVIRGDEPSSETLIGTEAEQSTTSEGGAVEVDPVEPGTNQSN